MSTSSASAHFAAAHIVNASRVGDAYQRPRKRHGQPGRAVALARPLIGVSTLEALTMCAAAECGDGEEGLISPWVDALARRSVCGCVSRGCPADDTRGCRPRADVPALDGPVLFVGDGAVAHRAFIVSQAGDRGRFAPTMTPHLAPAIARLAAARAQAGERPAPHAVAPLYVRRPDAEMARDHRAR